jgi:hypothetical protein
MMSIGSLPSLPGTPLPNRTIGDLLVATEELKTLTARTRRLRELQKLYSRSAPRELAGSSRVKSYKAGVLCVTADNGVVAAKLKQLAPTLLRAIRRSDADVAAIRIEVQVRAMQTSRQHERRPKTLPPQAVDAFQELAERVTEEPLKLALANLIRHHRKRATKPR